MLARKQPSRTPPFLGCACGMAAKPIFNPEIDQGYGLQGTLGVAGFTSAEAYKAGHARP